MADTLVVELQTYGPDRCAVVSIEDAQRYCRRLTRTSCGAGRAVFGPAARSIRRRLSPQTHTHLATIAAFACWADLLNRDVADTDRALELLDWWQRELDQCLAGEPRHPVFIALADTLTRQPLPPDRFRAYLRALVDDRTSPRAATWQWLESLARRRGGSLAVLAVLATSQSFDAGAVSSAEQIGIALWLTDRWQHLRRDVAGLNTCHGRRYLPAEFIQRAIGAEATVAEFDDAMMRSAQQGYGVNRQILEQSRRVLRNCIERTCPLFDVDLQWAAALDPAVQRAVHIAIARAQHMLRKIHYWNYETALHEPSLATAFEWYLAARVR